MYAMWTRTERERRADDGRAGGGVWNDVQVAYLHIHNDVSDVSVSACTLWCDECDVICTQTQALMCINK